MSLPPFVQCSCPLCLLSFRAPSPSRLPILQDSLSSLPYLLKDSPPYPLSFRAPFPPCPLFFRAPSRGLSLLESSLSWAPSSSGLPLLPSPLHHGSLSFKAPPLFQDSLSSLPPLLQDFLSSFPLFIMAPSPSRLPLSVRTPCPPCPLSFRTPSPPFPSSSWLPLLQGSPSLSGLPVLPAPSPSGLPLLLFPLHHGSLSFKAPPLFQDSLSSLPPLLQDSLSSFSLFIMAPSPSRLPLSFRTPCPPCPLSPSGLPLLLFPLHHGSLSFKAPPLFQDSLSSLPPLSFRTPSPPRPPSLPGLCPVGLPYL